MQQSGRGENIIWVFGIDYISLLHYQLSMRSCHWPLDSLCCTSYFMVHCFCAYYSSDVSLLMYQSFCVLYLCCLCWYSNKLDLIWFDLIWNPGPPSGPKRNMTSQQRHPICNHSSQWMALVVTEFLVDVSYFIIASSLCLPMPRTHGNDLLCTITPHEMTSNLWCTEDAIGRVKISIVVGKFETCKIIFPFLIEESSILAYIYTTPTDSKINSFDLLWTIYSMGWQSG